MADKIKISTDLIVDAARATKAVYVANAAKLFCNNHPDTALVETTRATLMSMLAADENLCEMLDGRIHQLGHGVK